MSFFFFSKIALLAKNVDVVKHNIDCIAFYDNDRFSKAWLEGDYLFSIFDTVFKRILEYRILSISAAETKDSTFN